MAKNTKLSSSFASAMDKYATHKTFEMIPVGVEALNTLWGGGIVLGYMYSFWGDPGCGKSTLTLQCVKAFCKAGLKVLIIDVEKAINDFQKKTFGLDQYIEDGLLMILTVTNFAEYEDLCVAVADQGFALVVTDSETAISPITPAEMKVTDVRPGLRSAQESFCLNKIKDLFYKNNVASIMLFHARANITMTGGTQPDKKQAGGFAAGHYPDVITRISAHAQVKEDDVIIGNNIRIVTTKNKFTAPFVTIEKKLIYGIGVSKRIDTIDTAIETGLIKKGGGGYYELPDGTKVRGTKALYASPNSVLSDLSKRLKGLTE